MNTAPFRWTLVPALELTTLSAAWDELQTRTVLQPFLTSGFLLHLLKTFGQGNELLAYADGGKGWRAAVLLQPVKWGRWTSFQPSQLPLGPVLATPDEDVTALADSLRAALPGLKLALGLTQLDFPLLRSGAGLHPRHKLLHYIDTAWVDVDRPFDTYWEERGKNLRQNTRKQRKKVESGGISPTLACLEDPAEMAPALDDYGRLEGSGWKAELGTAISADNAQGRFYRDALEQAAAEGRARIYRYCFGDEVVAMDLCLWQGENLVILKTAYQTEHQAVSPSTLMRQEQFKLLFDEGRFKRIEFFGRVMEWHTRWTENVRGLYHLTTYRWAWLRRLHDRLNRKATA